MNNIIHANMAKALSNTDIIRTKKCPIYQYKELKDVSSIDDLGEYFIILIPIISDVEGHWVSCIRRSPSILEYYDPLGHTIDKIIVEKNKPQYLTQLCYRSGVTVICNKTKLQGDSNTCGRHALIRILMRHLNLADYIDLYYNQPNTPDEIVTYLTMYI